MSEGLLAGISGLLIAAKPDTTFPMAGISAGDILLLSLVPQPAAAKLSVIWNQQLGKVIKPVSDIKKNELHLADIYYAMRTF